MTNRWMRNSLVYLLTVIAVITAFLIFNRSSLGGPQEVPINQIIEMARDAGAAKVYFASAAPPVRYPNVYGIDMPSASELIAHGRSVEQVCELIGADWLVYQDLDELIRCSLEGNPDVDGFDCSVFDGEYVTGDVDQNYLDWVESLRNDEAQSERRAELQAEGTVVGLHNDV